MKFKFLNIKLKMKCSTLVEGEEKEKKEKEGLRGGNWRQHGDQQQHPGWGNLQLTHSIPQGHLWPLNYLIYLVNECIFHT